MWLFLRMKNNANLRKTLFSKNDGLGACVIVWKHLIVCIPQI